MNFHLSQKPERIVCLTEEPTEILYLLGEEKRIVGISAFTCRPARAKTEKPVVSGFTGGNKKKIVDLAPDLVIGFSDIQAELAKDLIAANLQVLIFNQRSLQDILDVIAMMGRLVGAQERAKQLLDSYIQRLNQTRERRQNAGKPPRVYFEEWDDPKISGIRWVSELIDLAGGTDIFSDRAGGKNAKDRFVESEEIIARVPEIYIASWCGKPFSKEALLQRPGWNEIPAIRNERIYEMDPSIILQPGPACLTDGLDALEKIIHGD